MPLARPVDTALRCLGLAAAYAVTGKLGLLMAIPPGYATVVWPPSGLALAALLVYGSRLWPGVVLGSFAVNIATSFDPSGGWATARSVLIPLLIGGGAALQAHVGALLVRRHAGRPLELVRERDVIAFFLLAGPVACFLNPTVGTGTLLLWGSIRPDQVAFTWWTWWVGDTIGVGVAAPLLLIALGEPRDVWRRRLVTAGAPLACVFLLTVGLFVWAHGAERSRIHAEFDRHAQKATFAVQARLDNAVHRVHSLASFCATAPEADRAMFSSFARRILRLNPGLASLSWNPRVADADRARFEQRERDAGSPGFRIVEAAAGGRMVAARPREEYVVAQHIEPRGTAPADGYDVASVPPHADALRRAAESGEAVATGASPGVLIILPVYAGGPIPETSEGRRRALRGFAIGELRLAEILRTALEPYAEPEIRIAARDDGATGPNRLLWSDGPGAATSDVAPGERVRAGPLAIGGRRWSLVCRATPSYAVAEQSWRPWITLAGGTVFMGFLGALLLMVTGKAILIERFGAERAAELSAANASLQREVEIRRQAQEALTGKETELRQAQKMEAIGRLAGGIAHDFNNLLTAIVGYGNVIESKLGPGDPLRAEVKEILNAGKRATNLTRQLLAFSRRQVLQPKVLDLNAVVADVGKILRRLIGEQIELVTRLDPGLGCVRADPSQVEQVILNLALNARDAMPAGGRLAIETENRKLDEAYVRAHPVVPAGDYVLLSVTDTGVGMDHDTQVRIFEPFFTTKEFGHGTGLGLSTVYGIVRQSGGHVWVYSEPGRGSTFKVYLPRVEGRAEEYKSTVIASVPKGGTETVLVAEDEEAVRRLLCKVLRDAGYRVVEAADGVEALREAPAPGETLHLLVSDLVMPGLGGRELAERMAAGHPGLKVLFVSGYTEDAMVRQGDLKPGTAFLSKPFSPEALLRKVRATLDGA